MFRVPDNNDTIVILLIVVIVGVSGFLLWQDKTDQQETIEIDQEESTAQVKSNQPTEATSQQDEQIIVHIGGAVANPGVYNCQADARLYQALDQAGGPTNQANLNAINLADSIKDGEKIIIPSKSKEKQTPDSESDRININSASQSKLEELEGVGPVTAQKIIIYRQQQGEFSKPEDLIQVAGIGDQTLATIKGQITY
ncbi:helix-hairpin-helix domain-containing protein [Halanaerobaculum tunisiense]